ncbi:carboxypeptidase-like regulatory domain-containing protein [Arenibacter sp. GZD96]|uniref:carboxypeptidase-like regulatory domain-containing protein n=1 Tax=Aurantibrevibacter litoralis TaxID=3106030 RepID=UPI002AFE498B|nr:carboxypeptidase-like regulatory domain-containing protein [Arenibacter sp. GZD-96]MEA1786695.1 carboxypeptidase-like regulatory domain-containing protein [Arenibacter sp. GZD-96]
MLRNRVVLLCFFLIYTAVSAQLFQKKKLEGKVYHTDGDIAAVHVLNTTTKTATITDIDGYFAITVSLADTLVFSAVQFQKKILVITSEILKSSMIFVPLEETLTQLDEVVVRPYSLSGDLGLDAKSLRMDPLVTAASVGLPNAYVSPLSKSERALFAATANPIMSFDPLINAITGRTKMLKKQVKREKEYARTERVRAFYADSLFVTDLKVPLAKIDDFMYFCEIDIHFQRLVDRGDKLQIWEYMRKKSVVYRRNNGWE